MTAQVFDNRICTLGEGPLWHPLRKQLFWFDIIGCKMLSQDGTKQIEWSFDEHVSAAGWIDHDTLLIASATGLWRFDIATGARALVIEMESDQPLTRSNDGRADPWGGFWIGTMGLNAEKGMGSIYRFYKGKLRKVVDGISISNSIAFSPDGSVAYFTDTLSRQIMKIPLAPDDGWPAGAAEVFIDLRDAKLNPDGSVVDAQGCLWNAQWGAGRVARYSPDGAFIDEYSVSAPQASCPAFGGDDMKTLFVTTAAQGQTGAQVGMTFQIETDVCGQLEHRIIL